MYAIIENGVVINIIEWDGKNDWSPDAGKAVKVPAGQMVCIDYLYQNRKFIAPEDEKVDEQA